MIEILDKSKCCGCTACYNVCPKKCITMEADLEGFKYPVINKENCIDCGLCEKVCPCLKEYQDQGEPVAYVIQNNNQEVLRDSTSGGFFTPLAQYIIENNGVVYGAVFDENFNVIHKKCSQTNKNDICMFRGSKYVQSDLGTTFSDVKSCLEQGRLVCFSGTPCQIEGLKYYLQRDYNNLITVDFVCRSIPSPLLWDKYKSFQENKYGSKIVSVNFRNKTYGYHSGTMKLEFQNGKIYQGSNRIDFYNKLFHSDICSRPSCYNCFAKKYNRLSDYTIYDSWETGLLVDNLKDNDKGFTNVVIHSKKGIDIFNKIKHINFIYHPIDVKKAYSYTGNMATSSIKISEERKSFYECLNQHSLNVVVNKFLKITKKDYVIEKMKIVLYKTGLLSVLKKFRR